MCAWAMQDSSAFEGLVALRCPSTPKTARARLEQRHEHVGHELYVLAPEVHAHKVRQRARKLHALRCTARSSVASRAGWAANA